MVPRFHVSKVSPSKGANSSPESGDGDKAGPPQAWIRRGQGVSYAQALNGETSNPDKTEEQSITLHIQPEGNGWLFRSAVAIMNRVVPLMTLKANFRLETDMDAQFRALGGRSVLITFQSQEARDKAIEGPWMTRWFHEVKPWRNEPASLERFVWLSCQGMPLNAWNANTFKRIGELWGSFIMVEEDTLKDIDFVKGKVLIATKLVTKIDRWIKLEVQGVMYDVKIFEESSFFNPVEVNPGLRLEEKKPLKRMDGMELEEEKEEEEDDVMQSFEVAATNGKEGVGENLRLNRAAEPAVLHGEDKTCDGVGGPKTNGTDKHLMLDRASDLAGSEDFESVVGDSVGLDKGMGDGLGFLAQGLHSSPHFDLGLLPRPPTEEMGDLGRVGGWSTRILFT